MRALGILAIGAALGYAGLCALLFFFQRSMIYFPQAALREDHTIALRTATERVLVSARPAEGPRAFVYFGGNAENVALNMPEFSAAMPDRAIYLLHYRGYGGSSGKPSERAIFADALTLFDEVVGTHPTVEVAGRSLGSAAALYVASRRPVARLILVTPFYSVQDVAARQFPYFPVGWLLRDKFESWRFAPQVTAPTMILAAEHDEVVPRESTRLLASRFRPGVATLRTLPGGHNTIDSPDYLRWIAEGR